MQLIEHSVPKKTAPSGAEADGGDELLFCPTEEGVSNALSRYCGGKILFVTDGESFSRFTAFASSPRAISIVFDGDALPLFSMPDGVSCVFASGSGAVLHAARYFSAVRRIPCVLFPTSATLCGAIEPTGEVRLGEKRAVYPLEKGEIVCDTAHMAGTFHRAYAKLVLCRLAEFELQVLNAFSIGEGEAVPFTASAESDESIVRACAALPFRLLRGECFTLSRLLEEDGAEYPEWTAYFQLTALYAAFFAKGKPRRYFTPDYAKRAKRCGTESKNVPSAEEYALRALQLERVRAKFLSESKRLLDAREAEKDRLGGLCGGTVRAEADLTRLKYLPELHGVGLCSVIRDFGLLEWDD